jgi:hypothetical protein
MDLRLLTQDTACDDQGSGSASETPGETCYSKVDPWFTTVSPPADREGYHDSREHWPVSNIIDLHGRARAQDKYLNDQLTNFLGPDHTCSLSAVTSLHDYMMTIVLPEEQRASQYC